MRVCRLLRYFQSSDVLSGVKQQSMQVWKEISLSGVFLFFVCLPCGYCMAVVYIDVVVLEKVRHVIKKNDG